MTKGEYKEGVFYLELDYELEFFEGYTNGEKWNGWSVPYFTKEQAIKVYNTLKNKYDFIAKIKQHDNGFFYFSNIDLWTEISKKELEEITKKENEEY